MRHAQAKDNTGKIGTDLDIALMNSFRPACAAAECMPLASNLTMSGCVSPLSSNFARMIARPDGSGLVLLYCFMAFWQTCSVSIAAFSLIRF